MSYRILKNENTVKLDFEEYSIMNLQKSQLSRKVLLKVISALVEGICNLQLLFYLQAFLL